MSYYNELNKSYKPIISKRSAVCMYIAMGIIAFLSVLSSGIEIGEWIEGARHVNSCNAVKSDLK